MPVYIISYVHYSALQCATLSSVNTNVTSPSLDSSLKLESNIFNSTMERESGVCLHNLEDVCNITIELGVTCIYIGTLHHAWPHCIVIFAFLLVLAKATCKNDTHAWCFDPIY